MQEETIAAIATPPGTGGVAIIRISGPQAKDVLRRVFSRGVFEHARMYHGRIVRDGELLDEGMAVFFRAPHSYTGEDVAELHCHGSLVGLRGVLDFVFASGARPAQAGEFTRRAFLNGKMDLTQAEAVCDFISASSKAGAKASLRQLAGGLKDTVSAFQSELTDLLAQVTAAVEYPEEDLEHEITADALPLIGKLKKSIGQLADTFEQGRVLKEGLDVAIAGKPNVGKSSLMNALLGHERAIVADVPGTTRDTIDQSFYIDDIRINLTDTAGIRNTDDFIESKGVERSKNAVETSKLTIFVLDAAEGISAEDQDVFETLKNSEADVLVVLNKLDASERLTEKDVLSQFLAYPVLCVSAKTGEGMEALRAWLYQYALKDQTSAEGTVITNLRHRYALLDAAAKLGEAQDALEHGMDMDCVTIDLNGAWMSLGEITGNTVSEEIIDRVFENFCLGK
ncbi:tRNA uridine-5-carboxymethylaminomethyl(34) synthesis GTPase MnmE [Christensenella timonensis]|uniref:tRNA uridine-5-carboxymethylaminomethyl(34) synthesis GTPase MnmE n=1 Tax=Christensenella timonensis TaxID=1816678 RepID=UPI000836443E|nr:tRNA uridine-5-carboxymethylaminomethyl(34) synthesis GTPase MnmE [Christensenella timonensis]